MNLKNVLRLHAVLAALYAVALLAAPVQVVKLLSTTALPPHGVDIVRLFGAAVLLIALIAWGVSGVPDVAVRRLAARALLVYVSIGTLVTLVGQLADRWTALGWSSVASYAIFVIAYTYVLFVRPERA